MNGHLDEEDFAAFLDRRLSPAERERAEWHLAECSACRQELVEIGRILHLKPWRRSASETGTVWPFWLRFRFILQPAAFFLVFALLGYMLIFRSSTPFKESPHESTSPIAISAPRAEMKAQPAQPGKEKMPEDKMRERSTPAHVSEMQKLEAALPEDPQTGFSDQDAVGETAAGGVVSQSKAAAPIGMQDGKKGPAVSQQSQQQLQLSEAHEFAAKPDWISITGDLRVEELLDPTPLDLPAISNAECTFSVCVGPAGRISEYTIITPCDSKLELVLPQIVSRLVFKSADKPERRAVIVIRR